MVQKTAVRLRWDVLEINKAKSGKVAVYVSFNAKGKFPLITMLRTYTEMNLNMKPKSSIFLPQFAIINHTQTFLIFPSPEESLCPEKVKALSS